MVPVRSSPPLSEKRETSWIRFRPTSRTVESAGFSWSQPGLPPNLRGTPPQGVRTPAIECARHLRKGYPVKPLPSPKRFQTCASLPGRGPSSFPSPLRACPKTSSTVAPGERNPDFSSLSTQTFA